MPPSLKDQAIDKALTAISQFSQTVSNDRARQWLDQSLDGVVVCEPGLVRQKIDHSSGMSRAHDEQFSMAAYLRRATGFSGSETGILVQSLRGEYAPFSAPRNIVAEKLLMSSPSWTTEDDVRKRRIQKFLISEFVAEYDARVDEEAMSKAISARHANHPWMIGNPDLFVIIDGKRWLIDIECPQPHTVLEYLESGVPFSWVVRGHQNAILARQMGIEVHGIASVMWNSHEWKPAVVGVPWDEDLAADVVYAGDYYWNEYVLKGELPSFRVTAAKDEINPPGEIIQAGEEWIMLKAISEGLDKRTEELAGIIKEWDRQKGHTMEQFTVFLAEVTHKRNIDTSMLANTLTTFGIDPNDVSEVSETGIDISETLDRLSVLRNDGAEISGRFDQVKQMLTGLEKGGEGGDPAKVLEAVGTYTMDLKGFVDKFVLLDAPLARHLDVERAIEALKEKGGDPDRFTEFEPVLSVPRGTQTIEAQAFRQIVGLAEGCLGNIQSDFASHLRRVIAEELNVFPALNDGVSRAGGLDDQSDLDQVG